MEKELVSIILPTFNSSKFIEQSIRSIQSQTYNNWELLITDDCSTDSTVKILKSYQKTDNRIKIFVLDKNKGAGTARNNSINKSKGRYIAFCDSDDLWFKEKLEKQINFIKLHDLSLTYSGYIEVSESGELLKTKLSKETISYNQILRNNYIHCFTAIYDSHILGKLYMPEIRKRQDWALWINILSTIGSTRGIIEPLGLYRKRDNSISSNKLQLLKYNWRIYRKHLGFSFLKTIGYMLQFLYFYVLKKLT